MKIYPLGAVLATLSFITMILIIPPMFWHFRNRNIGASVLVAWTLILLLFNFINVLLWPSDDVSNWYHGAGLCDVEVKIQLASQVALPASLACMLRALAAAMDTRRATLIPTKAQKQRALAIDLSWCIGFPLLQMLLHYIVQTHRYYIFGLSGCAPAVSDSWLTILLLVVPPLVWTLIAAYLAILVIIRLYRYRLSFNHILASRNTPKSRFFRLYLVCILWIAVTLPVQIYVVYDNSTRQLHRFSWSKTHNAENWNSIILLESHGRILFDRWVPVGGGIIMFIFFGFGHEARILYRSFLLAVGFARLFPSLDPERSGSTGVSVGSTSSKAKMLFKRKSKGSASDSTTSQSTVVASPTSEKDTTSLNATLKSSPKDRVKRSDRIRQSPTGKHWRSYIDEVSQFSNKLFKMRPDKRLDTVTQSSVPLAEFTNGPIAVHAAVTGGVRSQSLEHSTEQGSSEVLITKEWKQNSTYADPSGTVI